ncbi:hypothetical protein Dimus_039506 [Dionaea muscipula]
MATPRPPGQTRMIPGKRGQPLVSIHSKDHHHAPTLDVGAVVRKIMGSDAMTHTGLRRATPGLTRLWRWVNSRAMQDDLVNSRAFMCFPTTYGLPPCPYLGR